MATVQVRISLNVIDRDLGIDYRRSANFAPVMNTPRGPTPGLLSIPVHGRDIDLAELTVAGEVWITNNDPTNFVTFGIYDPETPAFYPLGEVLPMKSCQFRLSRALSEQFFGTGTGTGVEATARFHMRADTEAVDVVIEAWEA